MKNNPENVHSLFAWMDVFSESLDQLPELLKLGMSGKVLCEWGSLFRKGMP